MWLDLEIKRQFRFDNILDPSVFFDALSALLAPTDTLVLGCYAPRDDIRHFLLTNGLPVTRTHHHAALQSLFDVHREDYPHGGAFHISPDRQTLDQLVRFAQSVSGAEQLCDHVAAYSLDWPLFIFHDAFCCDPLFVSSRIARPRVEAFSRAIKIPFQEIDFEYEF
jgi:hypothetical protein